MSIYLLVCSRSQIPVLGQDVVSQLHKHLAPNDIEHQQPIIHCQSPTVVEFFGHGYSETTDNSLAVGAACHINSPEMSSPLPDHVQFVWQWNGGHVEIRNDVAGTRRIWYFMSDELFIASTSQRIIVAILRSFEPNENNYGWMLASACLAPFESWDRRIHSLRPDSRLSLDRMQWSISVSHEPCRFTPAGWTDDKATEELRESIESAVCALKVSSNEASMRKELSTGV